MSLVRRERFTTTIALNTTITFIFASAHTPMVLMFQVRGRNSLIRPKQPAQVRGRNSFEVETSSPCMRPNETQSTDSIGCFPASARSRNSLSMHEAERNSSDRIDWVFPRVGDRIVMVLGPEVVHNQCRLAPFLLCAPQLAVLFQHADDVGVLVPSAADVGV